MGGGGVPFGPASAPFDLGIAVRYVERGMSQLYMRNLVRRLKKKTLAKPARYPDLVDPMRLRAVRTLAEDVLAILQLRK